MVAPVFLDLDVRSVRIVSNVVIFPNMNITIVDLVEYWYSRGFQIVSSPNGWMVLEELQ